MMHVISLMYIRISLVVFFFCYPSLVDEYLIAPRGVNTGGRAMLMYDRSMVTTVNHYISSDNIRLRNSMMFSLCNESF